jgi:hypothetical protein
VQRSPAMAMVWPKTESIYRGDEMIEADMWGQFAVGRRRCGAVLQPQALVPFDGAVVL